MSAVSWTITNPGGSGTSALADFGLSDPQADFQVMAVSTVRAVGQRDYDSDAAWWAFDELVTIYRDGNPYFTGRVQECPDAASGAAERKSLVLADAWSDLTEIIYREPWAIGTGTFLYPRCVLGMDSAGDLLTTGEQIGEVVDYAISQGAAMAKGTIDEGYQLWPSEVRNQSCESIIVGELRFHPDWVAWLDHSTNPPTFHATVKSALSPLLVDVADEEVQDFQFAEVQRMVPRGVSIVYESASNIDGEVFRNAYTDEAGVTTGRRVIRAMVDLEGMDVQFQKSRIQTRTLPTNAASMTAWMKDKYPELADIPNGNFTFAGFSATLAPEGDHAPAVNQLAPRLAVGSYSDVPRELVSGTVEDWMRVKVRRSIIKYDLQITQAGLNADQKKVAGNFTGEGKTISVMATNATTRLYKGVSSFTEGEGRPAGLAAAVFAAATEQQFEGRVTLSYEDVPPGSFHARRLTLVDGETTLFADAVIFAARADIEGGRMELAFGPMPYLSAADFLDLQRIINSRKVKWVSPQERTANTLGATDHGGSRGDNVGGYDVPDTVTPPGGSGETLLRQWKATAASETTIDCTGGVFTTQPDFTAVTVADVTALEATASGHVILSIARVSSTRAVTGTPTISYAAGAIPASTQSEQIIPLAKVTVADEAITEIMPLQFEELHIFEDLAVVNGEFMLSDLRLAGRNIYAPPAP